MDHFWEYTGPKEYPGVQSGRFWICKVCVRNPELDNGLK
jgi:hypothetical protein